MEDVAVRWRRFAIWLPPLVWAGGLLLLSAQPADSLPPASWWQIDKLVHALLYFALGALTGRATGWRPRRLALAAFALACFGVLDEWSQSFSPGRTPTAADAVADAIGSWAGLLAASRYYHRRHAAHPQLRR